MPERASRDREMASWAGWAFGATALTPEQQAKKWKRECQREARKLQREIQKQQRECKKTELEIKK